MCSRKCAVPDVSAVSLRLPELMYTPTVAVSPWPLSLQSTGEGGGRTGHQRGGGGEGGQVGREEEEGLICTHLRGGGGERGGASHTAVLSQAARRRKRRSFTHKHARGNPHAIAKLGDLRRGGTTNVGRKTRTICHRAKAASCRRCAAEHGSLHRCASFCRFAAPGGGGGGWPWQQKKKKKKCLGRLHTK